jgi:pimeloyl-ACP methyl ester carboxylesterase
MATRWRCVGLVAAGLLSIAGVSALSQVQLPTRLVEVDGRSMRVWTEGLDGRKAGQPVVVLEAGAGAGLETWRPVFADIAKLAPVVAYDRSGHFGSEGDFSAPQTLKRNAESLHALLRELRTPPPYVLVGHSWGGIIIRGFSDLYAAEVVGLVYLDVPDFESTREEKAAVLPAEDRAEALKPMTAPPMPPDTPMGMQVALQQIIQEMRNDYPTARQFRQPSGIPAAVLVTTRADRMSGNGGAIVRLQIKRQQEWALTSSKGLFVLASHTGHQVHRDDPALVVSMIKHVLQHAPPTAK